MWVTSVFLLNASTPSISPTALNAAIRSFEVLARVASCSSPFRTVSLMFAKSLVTIWLV